MDELWSYYLVDATCGSTFIRSDIMDSIAVELFRLDMLPDFLHFLLAVVA